MARQRFQLRSWFGRYQGLVEREKGLSSAPRAGEGAWVAALALWQEMHDLGIQPSAAATGALVTACGRGEALDAVRAISKSRGGVRWFAWVKSLATLQPLHFYEEFACWHYPQHTIQVEVDFLESCRGTPEALP